MLSREHPSLGISYLHIVNDLSARVRSQEETADYAASEQKSKTQNCFWVVVWAPDSR